MRTSGKESDLAVLLIPLVLLIVAGLAFTTDGAQFFPALEKQLWSAVHAVGRWVSALFS
jgi:hypothetical protein